jgi:hypothetical protein
MPDPNAADGLTDDERRRAKYGLDAAEIQSGMEFNWEQEGGDGVSPGNSSAGSSPPPGRKRRSASDGGPSSARSTGNRSR